MQKALKPCRQPGCPNLVQSGYCKEHKIIVEKDIKLMSVKRLRSLDAKKSEKEIKFYSSAPWIKTSKMYRRSHPFCERCQKRGYYHTAKLVHHKKELRDIWKDNGNPLRWSYLEALCINCHMEDLRKKTNEYNKNNKNQYKY